MQYVIVILALLFILFLLRTQRPKTAGTQVVLLTDEDASIDLPLSGDDGFERCESALEGTGAEIRCSDIDRGLLTAAYRVGGHRDKLAVIVRVHPSDAGCEVLVQCKADSFSSYHDQRAAGKMTELCDRIRNPLTVTADPDSA